MIVKYISWGTFYIISPLSSLHLLDTQGSQFSNIIKMYIFHLFFRFLLYSSHKSLIQANAFIFIPFFSYSSDSSYIYPIFLLFIRFLLYSSHLSYSPNSSYIYPICLLFTQLLLYSSHLSQIHPILLIFIPFISNSPNCS